MLPRTALLLLLLAAVALAAVDYPSHRQHRREREEGRRGHHRGHHQNQHHPDQHHRGNHRGRGHRQRAQETPRAQNQRQGADAQAASSWFGEMMGPLEPLKFDWNINYLLGGGGPWWRGINICESRHESTENVTNPGSSADGAPITHHHFFTRSSCDETPSAYRCTTVANIFGRKKTVTVTLECCHGYERQKGKTGCPVELTLHSMKDTMEDLGAGEMVRGMDSMGLTDMLEEGNFTVFAPRDQAFKNLLVQPDRSTQENVVVITPELKGIVGNVQQVLMAHIVPGIMRTGVFSDELLLPTSNPDAKIRINVYDTPKQLITANCVPIDQPDKMALNGVVHIVQGLLPTAENTVADIVGKNPELSTFKTMLGRLGIVQALRTEGQYTLFAPTNSAFSKIKPSLLNKLLYGESCLGTLVRTHLLNNVICSSIIIGKVKTRNVLGNYVNMTRDADDKVWLGHAQLVQRDVMASNGVVHLIDNVLIPDDVLDILEVAEKVGASEFVGLVRQAGLTKAFETSENVTLFLPSNHAIMSLPADELAALRADKNALSALIKYHVTPGLVRSNLIGHNQRLNTLNGKTINVKEFFSAPFGIRRVTTAQCGRISHRDLETCNGVVHIVDKILLPPRGDVLDTLSQMSNMSTLVSLLKKSGLAESLQSQGPFTFLAPSNKAWDALDENTMNALTSDPQRLQGLLKHHISTGTICCAGVFHSRWMFKQRERMLDSSMVMFNANSDGHVSVGRHTPVTRCDITATNGVVHVIDQVLPAAVHKYARAHQPEPETNGRGKFKNFFQGSFENLGTWRFQRPDLDPLYQRANLQWDAFLRAMQNAHRQMQSMRFGFSSKKK